MSAFTVAQISDTHLRREPSDPNDENSPDATLARTVSFLAEYAPDLVVLTGDIADDGSSEALLRAREIVGRLGVPILATPGNHDTPAAVIDVFGTTGSIYLRSRQSISASVTSECNDDQRAWRILTVDTVIPRTESGRVDVADVAVRLAQDPDTPTVIALHHPPISRSTHPWFQLAGNTDLVALLADQPQVKAVVSGHLHESFHMQLGHISYLGCPSSWYAIAHQGANWTLAKTAPVGAHILHLSHTGRVRHTLAARPF